MMMLDQTDSTRAERCRRALRQIMRERDLKPADLARKAGLPNANALYNLLNGRAKSLSIRTYQALANALPGVTVDMLSGAAQVIPSGQMEWIPLRGSVRAGTFMGRQALGQGRQQIAVPPQCVVSPDTFAALVDDESCNRLYKRGTLLVVTPFRDFDTWPLAGKKALVYRHRDGRIEATVREIEGDAEGVLWLWFRSSEPRHQGAVPLPSRYRGGTFTLDASGETLEIAGIITYSMRPEA